MQFGNKESINNSLCQRCGGRCCQGSPGVWISPERFFVIFFDGERLSVEQLRERLPSLGLVLWEKSGVPIPAPMSLESGCSFHAPNGCRLSVTERPCQCLALIPAKETLDKPEGCLCKLPDEFNRSEAQRRWQDYWQKGV